MGGVSSFFLIEEAVDDAVGFLVRGFFVVVGCAVRGQVSGGSRRKRAT